MSVDGVAGRTGSSTGSSSGQNSLSNLLIGGIDVGCDTASLSAYRTILNGRFLSGYRGCLSDVVVNRSPMDLGGEALRGARVSECL